MIFLNIGRGAFGFCTVISMLTACGGSPPPIGSVGATPQGAIVLDTHRALSPVHEVHAKGSRSWMSPTAKASDLVYVADQDSDDVYVYSWPKGQLVGTLTGFTAPSNLCSDAKGDLYVPNYLSQNILEYAHGGTSPIETLGAPGEYPYGCAVDPKTGDLAVTNFSNASNGAGNLLIYKKAKGTPKAYADSSLFYWYNCGYDNKSNLFVDGNGSGSSNVFAELPSGRKTLTNITINADIAAGGGIQWNGQYITFGNANGPGVIYEVQVSGSQGTVEGSTTLANTSNVFQYWIQGTRVAATNTISFGPTPDGNFGIWNYPAGGKATKTIEGLEKPDGVTVSLSVK
jgi:hypothetical protein